MIDTRLIHETKTILSGRRVTQAVEIRQAVCPDDRLGCIQHRDLRDGEYMHRVTHPGQYVGWRNLFSTLVHKSTLTSKPAVI